MPMATRDELGQAWLDEVDGVVAVNKLGGVKLVYGIQVVQEVCLIKVLLGQIPSNQNFVVYLALILFQNQEMKGGGGLWCVRG